MIRSKKSLGQNFLKSKEVIREILRSAEIKMGETVLEIGPGKGVLTEALLSSGAKVIAVEKDRELAQLLREKFAEKIKNGQLVLLNEDILKFEPMHYTLQATSYKLVANIPYNITGEILRKFIGGEAKPSRAVLLVQNEVAKRIVASDGKEGILSISIKAYGNPKFVKKVPAKYFSPEPKVDSAILLIENIKEGFAGPAEEKRFFEILKAGFTHKRKLLSGNLSRILDKEKIPEIFTGCGIKINARAENIPLEKWICLSNT